MPILSKSKIIAFRQHPWLEVHRPELLEDSAITRTFFTQTQTDARARRLKRSGGRTATAFSIESQMISLEG